MWKQFFKCHLYPKNSTPFHNFFSISSIFKAMKEKLNIDIDMLFGISSFHYVSFKERTFLIFLCLAIPFIIIAIISLIINSADFFSLTYFNQHFFTQFSSYNTHTHWSNQGKKCLHKFNNFLRGEGGNEWRNQHHFEWI